MGVVSGGSVPKWKPRGQRNPAYPRSLGNAIRRALQTPKPGWSRRRDPGNQPRACACAKGSPAPAHPQVRSRFRPAFPGRKPQSPRMRFPALLLGHRGPQLQVIPPLPLSERPIARRWAGISRRRPAQGLCETGVDWLAPQAQVRASYWVWAEREPPRLPRRLQVSARTRRGSLPPPVRARAGSRGRRPRARLRRLSPLLRPLRLLLRRRFSRRGPEGESRPRPPLRQSDPQCRPVRNQPSGSLRGHPSRCRPSAGACEEAPGPLPRPEPAGRALTPRAPGGRPGWRRPPRGPASA